MIIFLYGQDSYRSRQKLNEIVGHYKSAKKSGLNLIYIDVAKIEFSDFYDHLKIASMFEEKKLIILKNVFSNKKFQEDFVTEIKKMEIMADVVVVYEDGECDARLKLFKALLKECKCQEFGFLDGKQLKTWAATFAKASAGQAKFNMDALDLLINYVGSDMWRLQSELKKLANFKAGGVIKKEDVELMVRPRIEIDIFKTIDALAQKNKKQALLLLRKHLDLGEVPLYLLSMIGWQFRNLLVVKELAEKGLMYNSIVQKSGLHPFVVKKNYYMCGQFTLEELKNIYRTIFKIDSDIKTGKIEAETALDLFVAGI